MIKRTKKDFQKVNCHWSYLNEYKQNRLGVKFPPSYISFKLLFTKPQMHMSFKDELDYLTSSEEKGNNFNQRVQLTQAQIDQIKKTNSNIPVDFLDYLMEIGFGSIMYSQFKVYNDLTDFFDLGLNDWHPLPAGVKLFGDNFSGDFSGFDLSKEKTDEVVEFWHDSKEVYYTGKTFREYIREKMLMPHS